MLPATSSQATVARCSSSSSIFIIATPKEKGVQGFLVDFLIGVSAVMSKIAVAPIEHVKLLIQN